MGWIIHLIFGYEGDRQRIVTMTATTAFLLFIFVHSFDRLLLSVQFVKSAKEIVGTVTSVDLNEAGPGKGLTLVQYYTRDGRSRTIKTKGDYLLGDEVSFYLWPGKYDEMYTPTFWSIWVFPFFSVVIVAIIGALSVVAMISAIQRKRLVDGLLRNGKTVEGVVVDVLLSGDLENRIPGQFARVLGILSRKKIFSSYILDVEASSDQLQGTKTFFSEWIFGPPVDGLKGNSVTVYFAQTNKKVFFRGSFLFRSRRSR